MRSVNLSNLTSTKFSNTLPVPIAIQDPYKDVKEHVIPNDGVPFITASRSQMTCMFGRDKHAQRKKRAQEEQEKFLKELWHKKYLRYPRALYLVKVQTSATLFVGRPWMFLTSDR
jgi:hypothetical protein